MYSCLYSLAQSFIKHLLNAYYVLDTRERVEGKTDQLSALRKLTWGAGGRWLTSTETGDCGLLINTIKKTKRGNTSDRD